MTGMQDRHSSCNISLKVEDTFSDSVTHVCPLVSGPTDWPSEQINGDAGHKPARYQ